MFSFETSIPEPRSECKQLASDRVLLGPPPGPLPGDWTCPVDNPIPAWRYSICFDPAKARMGDRIGLLTITSDPQGDISWPCWNLHPELFPIPYGMLAESLELAKTHTGCTGKRMARLTCDCGAVLERRTVTGDSSQFWACSDCYRWVRYGITPNDSSELRDFKRRRVLYGDTECFERQRVLYGSAE